MPIEQRVSGTVIQRSFVGDSVSTIINIASVPFDEISSENMRLEDLAVELFGVPRRSILTLDDFIKITGGHFLPPLVELMLSVETLRKTDSTATIGFLGGFISTLSTVRSVERWYGHPKQRIREWEQERLWKEAIESGISDEAASILYELLRFEFGTDMQRFFADLILYEIPLGQSPKVKGQTLLDIIKSTPKVCIAPVGIGSVLGGNLLAQGQYIAAIETTATSGAISLILIGTVGVGGILAQRLAQFRNKKQSQKSKSERKSSPFARPGVRKIIKPDEPENPEEKK